MSNATDELDFAEARVVACAANVAVQGQALKLEGRRMATSPLAIGGLIAAAAVAGYVAGRRGATRGARSYNLATHENPRTVPNTAGLIPPLLGILGSAMTAFARNQKVRAPVLPQPQNAAQKPAVAQPWAAPPQGSWLSQQWQMIMAAIKA